MFSTDQFVDGSSQSIANLKNPTFFGASVPAVNSSLPTQHLALFVQDTWGHAADRGRTCTWHVYVDARGRGREIGLK